MGDKLCNLSLLINNLLLLVIQAQVWEACQVEWVVAIMVMVDSTVYFLNQNLILDLVLDQSPICLEEEAIVAIKTMHRSLTLVDNPNQQWVE